MNNTDSDTTGNDAVVPETPQSSWPSPGQKLKKLREDMGLSHARVADALHMTAHYVKALENDQYEKLPGKTFVKGYFRAYARLLGADVDDIMQCYQKYNDALEETEESEANVIRAQKAYDQNMRWLVAAAVIIIVVVGVSWWFSTRQDTEAAVSANTDKAVAESVANRPAERPGQAAEPAAGQQSAPAPASQALVTAPPAVTPDAGQAAAPEPDPAAESVADAATAASGADEIPLPDPDADRVAAGADAGDAIAADIDGSDVAAAAGSRSTLPDYTVTRVDDDHRLVSLDTEGEDTLAVHFSGASWIEIDNADNNRLYHDMLHEGDDLSLRGKAPFNILIGDANVVELTFNSRQVEIARIRSDNSARILLEPENR